ncbi:Centromere protein H C-terminal domain-containing protein [Camponotus japonicus]
MELDELEQSVKGLNAALNKFPIGAISLNDFKPVEEKIQTARESLMHLNARLLMLQAKYKQYTSDERRRKEGEPSPVGDTLQNVTSDTLINAKAIKLCLHSTTILSILSNKEGDAKDQEKLYTYMSKLFAFNDSIMAIQEAIERESRLQLDLKIECQKALFDYKNFLKEQERIRSERLQETNPEIVENKNKMERTLRRINIMKKLIRNFIAASRHMLMKQPILLEMLENHRELINVETILKMSQNNKDGEDT